MSEAESNQTVAKRSSGAQPGNNNRSRPFYQATVRALARQGKGKFEKGINRVAERLVKDALEPGALGSQMAIRDTLDGKPKQQVEHMGADGGAMTVTLNVKLV